MQLGSNAGKDKNMEHKKFETIRSARRRGDGQDPLGTNSEIARKLKQYYDDIVSEEVPDRFTSLLSQLEEREESSSPTEKD